MSGSPDLVSRQLLASSIVNVNRLTCQCNSRSTMSLSCIYTAQAAQEDAGPLAGLRSSHGNEMTSGY